MFQFSLSWANWNLDGQKIMKVEEKRARTFYAQKKDAVKWPDCEVGSRYVATFFLIKDYSCIQLPYVNSCILHKHLDRSGMSP